EGLRTILVNSNPATIQTDPDMADAIYFEPLQPDALVPIIARERPDGILPTLGGQVGLNLAMDLHQRGVLEEYGVRLLGTSPRTIRVAEDRAAFKGLMQAIGEPVPESRIVQSIEETLAAGEAMGLPLIVRPAFTLGGTGGGVAYTLRELEEIASGGLKASPIGQLLLERSLLGWKEIEYEVVRDGADNCITICNMENLDPMGVHTGDSIVVAPSQTLSDQEYQRLRTASIKIIRALGVEGACNVQLALDPASFGYYVIEVNPRLSRSSALASKATGYPIAKIAAKIAVGYTLPELKNQVTGQTSAAFEPALDYVVAKVPRWPFDKFAVADRTLGPQMKATGEVMAIDRSLVGVFLKALSSLETPRDWLYLSTVSHLSGNALEGILRNATDERLFAVLEALKRGYSLDKIHSLSGIDRFFLEAFQRISALEAALAETEGQDLATILRAYRAGFPLERIAFYTGRPLRELEAFIEGSGVHRSFRLVDTCAAEFEAATPYYYSVAGEGSDLTAPASPGAALAVLGSGPIRIGQGIEFDYCSVHAVKALRQAGRVAVIVNNNPETVSTDFDTADHLFFEPLTTEHVLNALKASGARGVIVQFGGQTALNLARPLADRGIPILGTPVESLEAAEDRELFDALVERIGVPRPAGAAVRAVDDALAAAHRVGYPVVVRPSFVLGGRAMEIVYTDEELRQHPVWHQPDLQEYPVLVDQYLVGQEVEIDCIADGRGGVLIPGIMEHVERAGIHSGDSMAVYPTQSVRQTALDLIAEYSIRLCQALGVVGCLNVQYIVQGEQVWCLEANPRASRTVPFLSKITGINMVHAATRCMLGESLAAQGLPTGLLPARPLVAVKAPVFSFEKIGQLDISLGPEMKSTGEVMGLAPTYAQALRKAFLGAGTSLVPGGGVLITVADRDKPEAVAIARRFAALGYRLYATGGTAKYLSERGLTVEAVPKISEGHKNPVDLIREGAVSFLINTPGPDKRVEEEARLIRRASVVRRIPGITSLDTAEALLTALEEARSEVPLPPLSLEGYVSGAARRESGDAVPVG
ncbi:MAG TPA: carbamoyl-phosphate synthase large subunit, partial [bacterium]|nr:carbamoyl-phosphate synthase large subunit [bacterium]